MNLFSPTTIQSRIELMIFGKRPFMPPIRSKYITVTQQQHTVSAEKTFRPPNNVAKATVIIIKCIISNGDWWVINKTLRNARLPPIDPKNKKEGPSVPLSRTPILLAYSWEKPSSRGTSTYRSKKAIIEYTEIREIANRSNVYDRVIAKSKHTNDDVRQQ